MIRTIYSTYTTFIRILSRENKIFFWDNMIYSTRTFIEPLILFIFWAAVASNSTITSVGSMALYFVALVLVSRLTGTWIGGDLRDFLQDGNLFHKLLLPIPGGFIASRVLHELNLKYSRLTITLPIFIAGYIFLSYFTILPTIPLSQLLFFIPAVICGATINFCFWLIISSTAFWFYNIRGVEELVDNIIPFTDGSFIPLIFLPVSIATFLKWLPFRYTMSFPLEIISQPMSQMELLSGSILMMSWSIFFILASTVVWKKGLKVYQG